ncbi:MAG: hypothetical protein HOH19_00885 [Kordiimonadaceae bacterium]|jgi:hypothetical protein|nr:hypothetical protein [Kordiimonadaceae bacterium]MBT6031103.1 hypothetical protein [Kordiimonadaceae bacterium]
MDVHMQLVEGRECGECRACCQAPPINSHDIVKLSNTDCHNLRPDGKCKIYADRPSVCSAFHCVWRSAEALSNDWRPDKFGVLIEYCQEDFPGIFADRVGYRFRILDKEKAFANNKFRKFVARQIKDWVPCVLTYGLNPGQVPASVFLNITLAEVVKNKDSIGLKIQLLKALENCEKLPEKTMKIKGDQMIPVTSEDNK